MDKTRPKDASLKPVCYFYGPEDYLMEEAVASIKKEALTPGLESMNLHVFDSENLDANSIIAAAETMPAFSEKRVVVIKDAEALGKDDEELLIQYIKNPSPSSCLIFVSKETKVDRGSEFFSTLSSKGYLRAFYRLKGQEVSAWIRKEALRQGKRIAPGALQKLVELSGEGLREIKGELDKIILYAGGKDEIDDGDVADSGLDLRDETIYSLSDAIGSKDARKALRIYSKLSGEPPVRLLNSIARQIRMLLKAKALMRRRVPKEKIPGLLGVQPWQAEGYIKRSGHFRTEGELKRAIERLREADKDIKGSRVPEKVLIPKVIMELCSAR